MNLRIGLSCLLLLAAGLLTTACEEDDKKKEGCGNGLLDLGEQCDGGQLQDATCASLGYYSLLGQLRCSPVCTYDTSSCGGRCGDTMIDNDDGEECDGVNLNGNACQTLGFTGGALACSADCRFDISGCMSVCGNGVVDGGEACDDGNQSPGDGCAPNCVIEDGWSCADASPSVCESVCGDSLVVGAEDCDGANLNGSTCQTLGFTGGTLACAVECAFDTSNCVD
jgi:cysteine-rich repeat protein